MTKPRIRVLYRMATSTIIGWEADVEVVPAKRRNIQWMPIEPKGEA